MEFLRAVSILLNTLLGGVSTETLCGRCYRLRRDSMAAYAAYKMFNLIFYWEGDHCRRAHVADYLITSNCFTRVEVLKIAKDRTTL